MAPHEEAVSSFCPKDSFQESSRPEDELAAGNSSATVLHENDVLFGRFNIVKDHPGNDRFNSLVSARKLKYEWANRSEKRAIAAEVINEIHSLQPAGRFLVNDPNAKGGNKAWICAEPEGVIEKVMHRLRQKERGGILGFEVTREHAPFAMGNEVTNEPKTLSPLGFDSVASQKPHANEEMLMSSVLPTTKSSLAANSGHFSMLGGKSEVGSQPANNEGSLGETQVEGISAMENDMVTPTLPPPSFATRNEEISLADWIALHRRPEKAEPMAMAERRKYLEESVQLLLSLGEKIIRHEHFGEEASEDACFLHPMFITMQNVVVNKLGDQISADFIECCGSIACKSREYEPKKKFIVMDAFGRLACEMFMLGERPAQLNLETRPTLIARGFSNTLRIQDNEEDAIMDLLAKNPRTYASEGLESSSIISTMMNANVPFPLCQFVVDLLDDDSGMLGRSEHSFSSFIDVLSDLTQMVDHPDDFIHASSPDRWKLKFGEKLYGREKDLEVLMDASDRVAAARDDRTLKEPTSLVSEVVMVSGHPGSGKSRLVREGGRYLQKKGWRFMHCKFDRVAHPQPLSILASAFETFFAGPGSCYGFGKICQRLEETISPEGLAILAKHIPSLHLYLSVRLPAADASDVNEKRMRTLLSNVLQAASSKTNPVLFFVDDLQWADPLSLTLLTALVNGAVSDPLQLFSANLEQNSEPDMKQDMYVMFVGSYRDSEVDEDNQLAKVLFEIQSDSSINLTNISLSRFTSETLNQMLSESFRTPVRRVRALSEVVMQKTDGQPLHVIEFVQMLVADNLLTHTFARGWEWDTDAIELCPITDSVAEMFAFKLKKLQKEILIGLQIVSCFGSQANQRVLSFVADYDGENSVGIPAAIDVALSEGLVEQAANLIMFSHDMIQKAAIDSIDADDLVPLLRKLVSTLIKNASSEGELDSILFVAVDLINRIGSDATSSPKQRQLFAELNSRAGQEAITVPDFSNAAQYAESGITFLSDSHWETQYELSLRLYETAALSHFSTGRHDKLMMRINAIFDHARDYSDKFETHCVRIKMLSMSDLSEAIEECLNALENLGEPLTLDIANIDNLDLATNRRELAKYRELFAGDRKESFLSLSRLTDIRKARAMKILSFLILYLYQQQKYAGAIISCQMMTLTMKFGLCEESVFAAAYFASNLAVYLDDIEEAHEWGRVALRLMNMYDRDNLIPSIHLTLYGLVFRWKEPLQSTLEPLAQGIRLSFAKGNVEFANFNIMYYISRSFYCGKNISVLKGEVEALARQHRNNFGNSDFIQYWVKPLHNTLCDLDGNEDSSQRREATFPFDKVQFRSTNDIMNATIKRKHFSCFHNILSYRLAQAFVLRDMEDTLKHANIFYEHFLTNDVPFPSIEHLYYEGLTTSYFMRQSGEEHYRVRTEKSLLEMKKWATYSDWNFMSKQILMEAEFHNAQGNVEEAAICYDASIKAAQKHKFIHEEAIGNELAGIFFLERGLEAESCQYFLRSVECYEKWGAHAAARRVGSIIQNNFDLDLVQHCPVNASKSRGGSKESSSKKHSLIN